jgi:hypothetical protein
LDDCGEHETVYGHGFIYIKGFDWMICEKHGTVYGQGVVYMYKIP